MESESDEDVYPKSQILPDGIVEFAFHYGHPFYTYQNNTKQLQPDHFAVSMMRKYVEIESSGETGFVSVRCYPWGAYHFFDVPIRNFLDQTIDARELWGNESSMIVQKLKALDSIDERFKLIEQFLLERLNEYRKNDNPLDDAVRLIRNSKGQLTIEEVCDTTNISKKQLERKFLASLGTTPKVFARITRFLNICQHMESYREQTLTQLALDCGYYDQAHFVKDFKEFSGLTPTEFQAKERVYHSDL